MRVRVRVRESREKTSKKEPTLGSRNISWYTFIAVFDNTGSLFVKSDNLNYFDKNKFKNTQII